MLSPSFLLFFHLYKVIFLLLFVFPIYNNVYPKYCQSYKKMSVNEIKYFNFGNYYEEIGFSKEHSYYSIKCLKRKYLLLLANKLIEKRPDPRNAKKHY